MLVTCSESIGPPLRAGSRYSEETRRRGPHQSISSPRPRAASLRILRLPVGAAGRAQTLTLFLQTGTYPLTGS